MKILDFGLAKLAANEEESKPESPEASRDDQSSASGSSASEKRASDSDRLYASLTRTGTTAGTAAYMSPEQVRKEKLDARTDLFSFGLVLYEMAAGRRAFTGETMAVVHDEILNETPDPARTLNSAVPRRLDAVITKALEKDRSRRYQSAAEMRQDIARVRRETQPARLRSRKLLTAASANSSCCGWDLVLPELPQPGDSFR